MLAFGACFGGNGTLVGAGANLVTAGICATNGHPVSFGMFFKFGFPCMMITMIVSTVYSWIRYVCPVCNKHATTLRSTPTGADNTQEKTRGTGTPD